MKKFLLILAITSPIFLTGCTNQEYVEELEAEVVDLENIIYRCNSQIEDAKSYAGESYEDMVDALDNLETCN